jgi:DNA-binding response OmpR family regulator
MSPRKILLVDDSTTLLLLERMVLDGVGCQILVAKDGEAGVRAALAHRPDLILLDAGLLPDVPAVCRQLRDQAAPRSILLLTDRGAQNGMAKGRLSGYDEVIYKPVDPEELLSKVRILLGD